MKHSALSAAVMAATLAFAAPAVATPEDRRGPVQQEESAAPHPDDGELSNFAAAFIRLMGVQHGYMILMNEEQDPVRLEEMKQSAVVDMTQAVEKDGLSVDRYNQIALAVRDSPELQGRVETILQQLAETPAEE